MKLRALEPEDLEFLYDMENDMELWEYGTSTAPISRYALRQYIATCKNDIFEDGQVRFAIQEMDKTVGLIDLTGFQPVHRRAEVGIVIHKDFQGRGFGRVSLELLKSYSRDVAGLHQIYAVVAADNVKARHLFQSSGFLLSHVLRDWLSSPTGEMQDACLFQCFLST